VEPVWFASSVKSHAGSPLGGPGPPTNRLWAAWDDAGEIAQMPGVVYLLGAGFNHSVMDDSWRLPPPLARNFFKS
jgi:hypothetical protein